MKKHILIIFLFFHFSGYSQKYIAIDTAQFECNYLYEFQQDSTSIYSIKSQEMTLQIGRHCSKFTATHKLFTDSLIMKQPGEFTVEKFKKIWPLIGGTTIHSYCRHYIFKNYPLRESIILTRYINNNNIKVSEQIHFQWKLIESSDTIIQGYSCKKATTFFAGRNYIAWYTLEIPTSDGPHKFHGLPGLIIKINDTQNHHRFEIVSVTKPAPEKPIFYKEEKYIEVSSKEYAKALNISYANLSNKIQQEDGLTINNDESKAKALNNIKSRNNFIERY